MQKKGDKERGNSERGFVRLLGTLSKDYGNFLYCNRKFKGIAVIKSEFAFFQFFFRLNHSNSQTLSDVGVEFLRDISKFRKKKKTLVSCLRPLLIRHFHVEVVQ